MENAIAIGILNIFEKKLREFDIQIPDDDREDSTDPIVGYHYAELHDRIAEYLDETMKPVQRLDKVHVVSIVNSMGHMDGNDSHVHTYGSLKECVDEVYEIYKKTRKQMKAEEELEDGKQLTKKEFKDYFLTIGGVWLQAPDYHIGFEYSVHEMPEAKATKK